MTLVDVMGHARLAIFAEIALGIVLALFAGVLVYTFLRGNRAVFERASRLPLESEATTTRPTPGETR